MLCNGCIAKNERLVVSNREEKDWTLWPRFLTNPLVVLICFAFYYHATKKDVRKPIQAQNSPPLRVFTEVVPQPGYQLDAEFAEIPLTEYPFQTNMGAGFTFMRVTNAQWEYLRSIGLTLKESSIVGDKVLPPGHVLLLRLGPIEYFCQVSPDGSLATLPDSVAPPAYFWAAVSTVLDKK